MSDSEYATRSAAKPAAKKKGAGPTVKGKKDNPTHEHGHGERGVQPEDDKFPKVPPIENELPVRVVGYVDDDQTEAGEHWLVKVTGGGAQGVKPLMQLEIRGLGTYDIRTVDANHSWAAVGGRTRQEISDQQGNIFIRPHTTAARAKPKK